MDATSPAESVHALNLEELRKPDITFWTAWQQQELLGCGAIKILTTRHAEIKSMRTARQHLRKGVAAKILDHIILQATKGDLQRLSLETGFQAFFDPPLRCIIAMVLSFVSPFQTIKPILIANL